jgi:hypothetical protein
MEKNMYPTVAAADIIYQMMLYRSTINCFLRKHLVIHLVVIQQYNFPLHLSVQLVRNSELSNINCTVVLSYKVTFYKL